MSLRNLFTAALTCAALCASIPAHAQGSEPALWLKLVGSDRDCTDLQVTIGGRICLAWTDRIRIFSLEKTGNVTQSISETFYTSQEIRIRDSARSGKLAPAEMRELRATLAAMGIASQRGLCNPFPPMDEFLESASYRLTWFGAGETLNRMPLGTTFRNHPCPQALLRLLHRINRITANLPETPAP
jgi:hypothetical protein